MSILTPSASLIEMPAIRRGRILRLKQGYNPNSSSVGSIVYALPAALLAVPTIYAAAAAMLLANKIKPDERSLNSANTKTSKKDA